MEFQSPRASSLPLTPTSTLFWSSSFSNTHHSVGVWWWNAPASRSTLLILLCYSILDQTQKQSLYCWVYFQKLPFDLVLFSPPLVHQPASRLIGPFCWAVCLSFGTSKNSFLGVTLNTWHAVCNKLFVVCFIWLLDTRCVCVIWIPFCFPYARVWMVLWALPLGAKKM